MHPFLTRYNQVSRPKLKEVGSYTSEYLVPRVTKVSINCGIGDLAGNQKTIDELANQLATITGQKPSITKARKAIAGFKIRENMVVGMRVTLRGERMQDFLTKLTDIALPRTRDFRGIPPTSVTAGGSLNVGIRDSAIFPEVSYGSLAHGLQVTVVSTATDMDEARTLFESLGFLFQTGDDIAVRKTSKKKYNRKR
jgi:large subunit ribosomal protein L5